MWQVRREVTAAASTSVSIVAPNATVKCNLCTYTCEQTQQRAHQYHYEAVHAIKYAAYECRLCRQATVNPQCCFKHLVTEHNRNYTDSQHVNCIVARYTLVTTCVKLDMQVFT